MDLAAMVYLGGLVLAEALRWPCRVERSRHRPMRRPAESSALRGETLVLTAVALGIWLLPAVHAFTPWLRPLDYSLPSWAVWLGVLIFLTSLGMRWKAQTDLGSQWSHTLETGEGHRLVTGGIYACVRHPIYVSLILWAAAQPLLLHNLAAGWSGAVAVALIWLLRVPREERLLLQAFGEDYRQYMARTGRLIPRRRPVARRDEPSGGGG